MDKEPRIDKNVAIPKRKGGRWTALAGKLSVGDSVVLLNYADVGSLRAVISRSGFGSVARKQDNGWRVWKTEKNDHHPEANGK